MVTGYCLGDLPGAIAGRDGRRERIKEHLAINLDDNDLSIYLLDGILNYVGPRRDLYVF